MKRKMSFVQKVGVLFLAVFTLFYAFLSWCRYDNPPIDKETYYNLIHPPKSSDPMPDTDSYKTKSGNRYTPKSNTSPSETPKYYDEPGDFDDFDDAQDYEDNEDLSNGK